MTNITAVSLEVFRGKMVMKTLKINKVAIMALYVSLAIHNLVLIIKKAIDCYWQPLKCCVQLFSR